MQTPALSMSIPQAINLAMQHYEVRNLQQAESFCRQILQTQPDHVEALHLLARIAVDIGNGDAAVECLIQACNSAPQQVGLYHDLAKVYLLGGLPQQALKVFETGINNNPKELSFYEALGKLCVENGLLAQATDVYLRAVAIEPNSHFFHHNLGHVYHAQYRLQDAQASYKRVLQLAPNTALACLNMANVSKDLGNDADALRYYQMTQELTPEAIAPRWGICMMQLPILYTSTAEIDVARKSYQHYLEALDASIPLDTPEQIQIAAESVGFSQPFYLTYQGHNDRDLQAIYGKMVSRIMHARYPQWSTPVPMPPLEKDEKIRVGVLSRYYYDHSNWKIPIRGWVQGLNREDFTVTAYSTNGPHDKVTEVARQSFDTYVEGLGFEALCTRILADNLHVLIIPENGMDAMTVRMASLHLAPVQCGSWGHPQTSGLPSMDYFLSSDLMEPTNGQEFYTEKLVRLPNLSIHYQPVQYPLIHLDLKEYGVKDHHKIYVCCQLLSKYLPQYDWVLPEIAKRVPDAKFLFISHPIGVSQVFYYRLKRVFAEAGLNAADYIVMLPYMDRPHFASLCSQAHVYLDSFGWSGCNSTLEALEYNLPIVTMPGNSMRGRHSHAILTMMDVTQTIAQDENQYIDIAVKLGDAKDYRQSVSDDIAKNRHRIYEDMSCVHALEDFLKSCVYTKSDIA